MVKFGGGRKVPAPNVADMNFVQVAVITEQLLAGFLAKCGMKVACFLGWLELKEKPKCWLAGV